MIGAVFVLEVYEHLLSYPTHILSEYISEDGQVQSALPHRVHTLTDLQKVYNVEGGLLPHELDQLLCVLVVLYEQLFLHFNWFVEQKVTQLQLGVLLFILVILQLTLLLNILVFYCLDWLQHWLLELKTLELSNEIFKTL